MIDYQKETRTAYKSPTRAAQYKRFHTNDWSWGRVSTRLEQRRLRRLLARRALSQDDVVLDVPCGTGVLGPTLSAFPARVVASDISMEMMTLARDEYRGGQCQGLVQADIASLPFAYASFSAAVVLGFMHRVPTSIRRSALAELHRVVGDFVIVSFSLSSPAQQLKQRVLRAIKPRHVPAPCAISREEAEKEMTESGFRIVQRVAVAPFLSAEWLYVIERKRRGPGA